MNYFDKIPKEYLSSIRYLNTGNVSFRSAIEYTNPGCGCVSVTTLGSLADRKQFLLCNKCINYVYNIIVFIFVNIDYVVWCRL